MSATSSCTPGIVENSCSTPSMRTAGDRRALERRQQHAAQRVAERHAEAALERLALEAAVVSVKVASSTSSSARSNEVSPVLRDQFLLHRHQPPSMPRPRFVCAAIPMESSGAPKARVQLDDELLVDGQGDVLAYRQRLHRAREVRPCRSRATGARRGPRAPRALPRSGSTSLGLLATSRSVARLHLHRRDRGRGRSR